MEKPVASFGGITFLQLLTIVFVVLKLTKYIDWSWWWVLAPLWIPVALVFAGGEKLILRAAGHLSGSGGQTA